MNLLRYATLESTPGQTNTTLAPRQHHYSAGPARGSGLLLALVLASIDVPHLWCEAGTNTRMHFYRAIGYLEARECAYG